MGRRVSAGAAEVEAVRNRGTRSAGQCEGPGRSTLPSSPGIRLRAVPPHGQPGMRDAQGHGSCTASQGAPAGRPPQAGQLTAPVSVSSGVKRDKRSCFTESGGVPQNSTEDGRDHSGPRRGSS